MVSILKFSLSSAGAERASPPRPQIWGDKAKSQKFGGHAPPCPPPVWATVQLSSGSEKILLVIILETKIYNLFKKFTTFSTPPSTHVARYARRPSAYPHPPPIRPTP